MRVVYRADLAECVVRILVAAPPEYVNIGFYKIFVHFNAFVNEPIIMHCPLLIWNAHIVAIALHDYCARYAPAPTHLLYPIHQRVRVNPW